MELGHRITVKPVVVSQTASSGGIHTINTEIRVHIRTDARSDATFERLRLLAERPEVMREILRATAVQTLIDRYSTRFEAARERMKEIHRMKPKSDDYSDKYEVIANKTRLLDKLVNSAASSSPETQKRIDNLKQSIEDLIEGRQDTRGKRLSAAQAEALGISTDGGSVQDVFKGTGEFKDRMSKVYAAIFNEGVPFGATGIGFGDLKGLEGIRTPSKHPTSSPYSTMWKQLEFGTGVYAVENGGPLARTSGTWKEGDGSWWYGGLSKAGRHTGVHFKGTKAGMWYRNASGLPYNSDTTLFTGTFYTRLLRYIRGQ